MTIGALKRYRGGIGCILLLAVAFTLWFGGNALYYHWAIAPLKFPRLEPGEVSLVGIRLVGENIIVSNGIARLESGGPSGFSTPSKPSEGGETGAQAGAIIPMKGLVQALQRKPQGVSELVAALNRINIQDIPPEDLIWDIGDLRNALRGEGPVRRRLEYALATTLDGGPVERMSKDNVKNGIYLRLPTPVKVPTAAGARLVAGEVVVAFRTSLTQQVLQHKLIKDKFDPPKETFAAVYEELAAAQAQRREDVAASIEAIIAPEKLRSLALPAERLLERVTVVLTERQISDAAISRSARPDGEGYLYSVDLELTEEGKRRLWQYTHGRPRVQLLFIADGLAIAAPIVQHEMKYATASISGIVDETLAQDAVESIRRRSRK